MNNTYGTVKESMEAWDGKGVGGGCRKAKKGQKRGGGNKGRGKRGRGKERQEGRNGDGGRK